MTSVFLTKTFSATTQTHGRAQNIGKKNTSTHKRTHDRFPTKMKLTENEMVIEAYSIISKQISADVLWNSHSAMAANLW